jgi:hypothetical protein
MHPAIFNKAIARGVLIWLLYVLISSAVLAGLTCLALGAVEWEMDKEGAATLEAIRLADQAGALPTSETEERRTVWMYEPVGGWDGKGKEGAKN